MRGKKKKLTLKQSQRIKALVLGTSLLICCCIALGVLVSLNIMKSTQYYKVEKRTSYITKEQKNDTEEIKTVAWLRVQGTNIDTQIIEAPLELNLDKVTRDNYLWNEDSSKEHYNQIKIQGHNILNLSANPEIGIKYFTKFEDLMAFTYKDFVEKNKYIQYSKDGKDYVYKVFAVLYDYSYNLDLHHQGNYSKEEMSSYLKRIEDKNLYDFDVDVTENDDIICLVTCTRMYGPLDKRSFMVVGRLLRDNEQIKNYTVNTTAEYKNIEKIMKGESYNEEV